MVDFQPAPSYLGSPHEYAYAGHPFNYNSYSMPDDNWRHIYDSLASLAQPDQPLH